VSSVDEPSYPETPHTGGNGGGAWGLACFVSCVCLPQRPAFGGQCACPVSASGGFTRKAPPLVRARHWGSCRPNCAIFFLGALLDSYRITLRSKGPYPGLECLWSSNPTLRRGLAGFKVASVPYSLSYPETPLTGRNGGGANSELILSYHTLLQITFQASPLFSIGFLSPILAIKFGVH
jgi:hypothetical protein